eukprot:4965461-Prymnesium_polylepis.1
MGRVRVLRVGGEQLELRQRVDIVPTEVTHPHSRTWPRVRHMPVPSASGASREEGRAPRAAK